MSKLVLDTNILVYAKDASSRYHAASIRLFSDPEERYVTSKNLSEYYAVVTRGADPLLSPSEALEDIVDFMASCSVLYPNEKSMQLMMSMIAQYQPAGLYIHDVEIAAIALAYGIKRIVTYNQSDFQILKEMEVVTP
jgi:predicted nucleic acid-binding protein